MSSDEDGDSRVVGLDAEWFESDPAPSSRRRGKSAEWIPWLAPEFLLCTGFFLGPAGTFVASLLVCPSRLSVRRVAFLFGLAGATWFLLEGGTILAAETYGNLVLRVGRTTGNFALGVVMLLFWRRQFGGRIHHSRGCLTRSVAVAAIYAVLFTALPSEWLFALGR